MSNKQKIREKQPHKLIVVDLYEGLDKRFNRFGRHLVRISIERNNLERMGFDTSKMEDNKMNDFADMVAEELEEEMFLRLEHLADRFGIPRNKEKLKRR